MADERVVIEFVGQDSLSPVVNKIKQALDQEVAAQRNAIKAQADATKEAEKLFQARARLSQQRVGEALKAEADAAKLKAQADREASIQAEKLFQTNAKLTGQRLKEALQEQANAAKAKALADREAAIQAEKLFQTNSKLSQQKVKEALQAQATAAKAKAAADKEAAAAAAQLAKEQAKLEKDFNTKTIQDQIDKTEKLRQGYQALSVGATALTAAVGGIFAKGVGDFVDFEGSIKTIGVISDEVGSVQLSQLTDEIKRLGIETSKTPQEIAKASIELTKAGFTAAEVKEAIGGIVQGAEATGESLTTVSDITAKTIRQFGLSAAESQRVADVLVTGANATNVSISTLGESLKFVGPAAAASGQSLEDTVALLGLLGDAGLQGGQGGRNLATALERLKIASAASESELKNLVRGSARAGEALQVLGLKVRNSDGSLKSLTGLLPELRTQLATLSKVDQDIVLKALFGVEGGRAVVALLGQSDERIKSVTGAVNNAAGASAKASTLLKEGLSGAFKLLDGSIGSASIKIGEFVSVGLEPLVRGATLLINTFLSLPGPIQGVIIGVGALTGAIAGAVAIIATYRALQVNVAIANAGLALQQTLQTAATIAQTVATTAQSLAQGTLNLVTKEFTLLQIKEAIGTALATARRGLATVATNLQTAAMGALAIATGKADAATLTQAGNLLKLAGTVALAGAAFATTSEALSRFSDGGKEFRDDADVLNKKLLDIELRAGKTGDAINSIIPKDPPPTGFIDGVVNFLNKADDDLQIKLGIDPKFGEITTNAEKMVNDARLGVGAFREDVGKLIDKSSEIAGGFKKGLAPTKAQLADAKDIQDGLTDAIQKTAARLASLDEKKLGTDAYKELKAQLETTKIELERTQASFQKATGATSGNTAATLADADASGENASAKKSEADSIKELNKVKADAIKQQRDDEKVTEERGFQDSEKAIARDLADQKAAREKKLQDDIAKRQEATEARVAALQKQNQEEADRLKEDGDKEAQERQRDFDKEQEAFKDTEESKIQARQRDFDRSQSAFKQTEEVKIAAKKKQFEQEISDFKAGEERKLQQLEKDFEQRQKDDERKFQREQQDKEKAFQSELDGKKNAATKQIDRTLQLEEADPKEREKLTKQFADEDKKAQRRAELERQILKPIQDQEEAFKKQQQAADDAFKARQEAEKTGFQDSTVDPAKRQIDQAVDQKKTAADSIISAEQQALEDALNAKKLEFEQGPLKILKDQLETELETRKLAFETNTLAPLKKQIETELEAVRTQGEARIATVKKASETEIQALKDAAATVERDKDRAAEDERTTRERVFKDDQRDKDRQSAQIVKEILESTTIGGLGGGPDSVGAIAADNVAVGKDFNGTDGIDPVRPFVTPDEAAVPKRKKRQTLADVIGRFTGGDVEPGQLYLGGEVRPEALQLDDGSVHQIGLKGPETFMVNRPGYVYPDWTKYVTQIQQNQAPSVNVAAPNNSEVVAALRRIERKVMGSPQIQINEVSNPDRTLYKTLRDLQRIQ